MGGFLGFGHSSAKTDRGAQLGARQGLWNVYNYGLPLGQQQEATGSTNVAAPTSYFSQLLNPTRQSTATLAAPAINAEQAQSDAARRQQATMGSSRTGSTVAQQAESATGTQRNIDDIVNQNLVAGRQAGATGLEGIGKTQLANAMSMLGWSTDAINSILSDATTSRELSAKLNAQTQAQWGQTLGALVSAIPAG